ncbi:MAG TPA: aspartate aminotransferase family protein [Acidimicrobiia bacterium]|nr:aspartate aminotransferase family protein [Acidimicrobiia bacterium]
MKDIRTAARDHLWLHFAQVPSQGPVLIERGDGCYVWDTDGNRYLDALAGLFVTEIGHGRSDLANAASKQAETMAFFPVWGMAHPPAAALAQKLAELSPGDMDRVFFTAGGSEAVESAWKLARQYHLANGEPDRMKVIARKTAYHGTTLGALSITSIPPIRAPFEPMLNHLVTHVSTTDNPRAADEIEEAILAEGPGTVAAVFLEPVQNSGGCFVPYEGYWQQVREICDRYGILLVSDEVICAFGRLGTWFGGQKFGYVPDMITFAKGATSGYAPLGGVITRPFIAEAIRASDDIVWHGITFGGHPVSCAVALANIEAMEAEGIVEHAAAHESLFRSKLETLLDHPIAAEVRGAGYFYAIELQKDPDNGVHFSREEATEIVGLLKPLLLELGMIARADGRGAPILQYSPPLIAGPDEFDEIVRISREALDRAWSEMNA